MATFFYFVGAVSLGATVCVLALVLVSVARPPLADRLASLRIVLTFVFLFAATLALSAYVAEAIIAIASSNPYERHAFTHARTSGPYAWAFWLQYLCVLLPQILWLPSLRRPMPTALVVVVSLLPTILHHVA